MERTRREFIREGTTLLAGASLLADASSLRAAPAPAVKWPIGCFNRPWTKWTFDETLAAIKAAGYATTGLLSRTTADPPRTSEPCAAATTFRSRRRLAACRSRSTTRRSSA